MTTKSFKVSADMSGRSWNFFVSAEKRDTLSTEDVALLRALSFRHDGPSQYGFAAGWYLWLPTTSVLDDRAAATKALALWDTLVDAGFEARGSRSQGFELHRFVRDTA